MNIRQLQALKAVIEHHTTTRAAERLGLTQPAVSGLIAALEKQLQIPLFERQKGRLLPTPEACRLARDAETVLISYTRLEQHARELGRLTSGELQIVSLPGPALEFMPRAIAEFLGDKPDVHLHFEIRPSVEVQSLIGAEYMDLGLTELPIRDQRLDCDLMTMRCVCVLPKDHPLAGRSFVTPADLDGAPFIALGSNHTVYSLLAAAFDRAGVRFDVRANVQLFAPICMLVACGAGVTVVDPVSAGIYRDRGMVSVVPFEPPIPYTIGLITPAGKPRSLLTQEFMAFVKRKLEPYLMER